MIDETVKLHIFERNPMVKWSSWWMKANLKQPISQYIILYTVPYVPFPDDPLRLYINPNGWLNKILIYVYTYKFLLNINNN